MQGAVYPLVCVGLSVNSFVKELRVRTAMEIYVIVVTMEVQVCDLFFIDICFYLINITHYRRYLDLTVFCGGNNFKHRQSLIP